jgi:integrase
MVTVKERQMEYLQHAEMKALLKVSLAYGNREAHLALLTMYGTGSRVSQVLALKGIDVIPDTETGGHRIRIGAAKRGQTRTYRVLVSPDPALDMRDLVELAKTRGTNALFGALDRHYLHRLIKRFAAEAGLHPTLHCHTVRHSSAMAVYAKTQRIGCVSGFLAHSVGSSAALIYVQENDGRLADEAIASTFAA